MVRDSVLNRCRNQGIPHYIKGSVHEGREGEKGGNDNFKIKHTEPLTSEIPRALYKSVSYTSIFLEMHLFNSSKPTGGAKYH